MAKEKFQMIVAHPGKAHLGKEIEIDTDSPVLDETQRQVNRLMGIGDAVFCKYSRGLNSDDPAKREQAQSVIDEFHKAGDLVFAKYQNLPEKWPGIIDDCQRRVNELMGISDETFLIAKNRAEPDPSIDETQRKVNQLMGLDDATFRKYNK